MRREAGGSGPLLVFSPLVVQFAIYIANLDRNLDFDDEPTFRDLEKVLKRASNLDAESSTIFRRPERSNELLQIIVVFTQIIADCRSFSQIFAVFRLKCA